MSQPVIARCEVAQQQNGEAIRCYEVGCLETSGV